MPIGTEDIVEYRVRARLQGQEVQNSFVYRTAGGWAPQPLADALLAFRESWRDNYLPLVDADYVVSRYEARTYFKTTNAPTGKRILRATALELLDGLLGTDNGTRGAANTLPATDCMVVESITGLGGNGNRGSHRLSGFQLGDASGGRWVAGMVNDVDDLYTQINTVSVNGSTLNRVILNKAQLLRLPVGTEAYTLTNTIAKWAIQEYVSALRTRRQPLRFGG